MSKHQYKTYNHPKWLFPYVPEDASKRDRGWLRKTRAAWKYPTPEELRESARNYFGQELLEGAKIEELKKDPYWKYMQEEN